MTDLVERLRRRYSAFDANGVLIPPEKDVLVNIDGPEAADEIERLRMLQDIHVKTISGYVDECKRLRSMVGDRCPNCGAALVTHHD